MTTRPPSLRGGSDILALSLYDRYLLVMIIYIALCTSQDVRGSSKLFSALLTRCLAREVMAICLFAPTISAAPRYVALVPQVSLRNCGVPLYCHGLQKMSHLEGHPEW